MVSVCLPSDALLQHLPSYLGFSYLGVGYLFTAAPPDLNSGTAPLGPPAPVQPLFLECGIALLGLHPWPLVGVAPLGRLHLATKCGPLEKGMASHISILALRTP